METSLLGFTALTELYNVHPVFVHFPIALLPAALLMYFLGAVSGRPLFSAAGRACLYMGAAGGVAAVITGLLAEGTFPHGEAVHRLMETHEAVGLAVLGLVSLALVWSFFQSEHRPRFVWPFLAVLGLAVLGAMQTADLGARMVYLHGAAVKPVAEARAEAGVPAGQEGSESEAGGDTHEEGDHTH